jgi:hypothetical protein
MFLRVAIRANQFQVIQLVMVSVSILVMHVEYFNFRETASFTLRSALHDEAQF